jgi:thymidylate synthase (FAD)
MKAEYIDHMGDDMRVVDAARVSFDKTHENYTPEQNTRLIKYLADHAHWSPLAHPQICLRITAPIFVARQCQKHVVGFVWNEVSRRYVDAEPTFFVPDGWRQRADNKKQGSSDELIDPVVFWFGDDGVNIKLSEAYKQYCEDILSLYKQMIEEGVAPEQARMILPQSMYTQWYWTGSLAAYARFYKQRTDDHAQKEIQDLAKMVGDVIQPLFSVSWEALTS